MEKNIEKYFNKRAKDLTELWSDQIYAEIREKRLTPIESLFYIEWLYQFDWTIHQPPPHKEEGYYFYIYPQYEINIKARDRREKDRKYQIDFLTQWTADGKVIDKRKALIVELDSYLWHGKTLEQFTKEKKRERDLMQDDWKIIRFSGREILKDPEYCVNETMNCLINREINGS